MKKYNSIIIKTEVTNNQSEVIKSYNSKLDKYSMIFEEKLLLRIEQELKVFNDIYKKIYNSNSNIIKHRNNSFSQRVSYQPGEIYHYDISIFNKKIMNIYSLNVECFLSFIVTFIIIIITLIVNKDFDKKNYIQDYNKKWVYECPLNKTNFIFNSMEFLMVIVFLIKVKKLWNYVFIFKSLKFIGYSSILLITLGPFINVSI